MHSSLAQISLISVPCSSEGPRLHYWLTDWLTSSNSHLSYLFIYNQLRSSHQCRPIGWLWHTSLEKLHDRCMHTCCTLCTYSSHSTHLMHGTPKCAAVRACRLAYGVRLDRRHLMQIQQGEKRISSAQYFSLIAVRVKRDLVHVIVIVNSRFLEEIHFIQVHQVPVWNGCYRRLSFAYIVAALGPYIEPCSLIRKINVPSITTNRCVLDEPSQLPWR